MPALPQLLAVLLIMTGVSGCALFDLLLGSPPGFGPDSSFPPFPIPSGAAPFTSGHATLAINSETVVLDELAGASTSGAELGTHVTWENDDGWYLGFFAYSEFEGLADTSTISIDRIRDHEHLAVLDPTRCVTTVSHADASGVSGSATCRGLRWADYFSSYLGLGFPQPIPSEPPFDAEVTFEAH